MSIFQPGDLHTPIFPFPFPFLMRLQLAAATEKQTDRLCSTGEHVSKWFVWIGQQGYMLR